LTLAAIALGQSGLWDGFAGGFVRKIRGSNAKKQFFAPIDKIIEEKVKRREQNDASAHHSIG